VKAFPEPRGRPRAFDARITIIGVFVGWLLIGALVFNSQTELRAPRSVETNEDVESNAASAEATVCGTAVGVVAQARRIAERVNAPCEVVVRSDPHRDEDAARARAESGAVRDRICAVTPERKALAASITRLSDDQLSFLWSQVAGAGPNVRMEVIKAIRHTDERTVSIFCGSDLSLDSWADEELLALAYSVHRSRTVSVAFLQSLLSRVNARGEYDQYVTLEVVRRYVIGKVTICLGLNDDRPAALRVLCQLGDEPASMEWRIAMEMIGGRSSAEECAEFLAAIDLPTDVRDKLLARLCLAIRTREEHALGRLTVPPLERAPDPWPEDW
jgi:hypothetical protein